MSERPNEQTKAEQLHAQLLELMRTMTPGQRMKSVRQMMQEYSVSQLTVDRVLAWLESAGRIERRPGSGIFVRQQASPAALRIAFVAPDWPSQSMLEMEEFLKREAANVGCSLHRWTYAIGSPVWNRLPFNDFDALIIMPEIDYIPVEFLVAVKRAPIPIVFRGAALKEIPVSSISSNPWAIGAKAAHYMVSRGHSRLAVLISEPTVSVVIRERAHGFKVMAEMLGAQVIEIDCQVKAGAYAPQQTHESLARWLRENPVDFSAMMAVSDETALAAMRAFADHGIAIPDQVSIIGCDGLRAGAFFHPPLTTVVSDPQEMARDTIAAVQSIAREPGRVIKKMFVPEVMERKSVKDLLQHHNLAPIQRTRLLSPS